MSNEREKKTGEKLASALKYEAGKDDAPYVVALGQGYVAEKMVEKANESGVSVVEDAPLANMLQNLSVGDEIPEKMYQAVAQILAFISDLNNEFESNKR